VRVIAGEARGRPLAGPAGPQTRPTSDKVKGALFSMLETLLAAQRADIDEEIGPGSAELWADLAILDLYAGTGALGIEALSRGAAWCDFIEANPAARRIVERNLRVTGLEERGRVIGLDAEKVMRGAGWASLHRPYSLVVLDPPYAERDVGKRLRELASVELLAADALVAVEHSRRLELGAAYAAEDGVGVTRSSGTGALVEVRQRRHGDTVVSIYRFTATGRGEGIDGDHRDLSR